MKTTIEQLEDCTLVTFDGEFNTAAYTEASHILAPLMENESVKKIFIMTGFSKILNFE